MCGSFNLVCVTYTQPQNIPALVFLIAAAWLGKGQVQKFVVVVSGVESKAVLERWAFNVVTDRAALAPGCVCGVAWPSLLLPRPPTRVLSVCARMHRCSAAPREKSHKEIQGEIQALIRQITASVTFLPLLDEPCAFDLLAYTDADATVPVAWEDSDPRYIPTAAEVRLRSFDTSIHKVAPAVSFRTSSATDDV